MSLPCLPELGEGFSARSSADGGRFVRLKSTPTADRFFYIGSLIGYSIPSPSGETLEHLTASAGVDSWMSSLRASRASRSASPESGRERETSETSGPRPSGSFARYDRATHGWKMCQDSLALGISEPFSEDWPKQGTMRDGVCSERTTLGPRTDANGSGFWRTPSATETHGGPENPAKKIVDGHSVRLSDQVRWPTPTSGDSKASGAAGYSTESGRHSGTMLTDAAVGARGGTETPPTYPTPRAIDGRAKGNGPRPDTLTGRINYDENKKRVGSLNPSWVEWLMGWPIGWTDSKPLATDRFREWCKLHGRD